MKAAYVAKIRMDYHRSHSKKTLRSHESAKIRNRLILLACDRQTTGGAACAMHRSEKMLFF
jgi:hypothetical protein